MKFVTINQKKGVKTIVKSFMSHRVHCTSHEILLHMEMKYAAETRIIICEDKGKPLLPHIPNE